MIRLDRQFVEAVPYKHSFDSRRFNCGRIKTPMTSQVDPASLHSGSVIPLSDAASFIREALSEGQGVVRLAPCWVPRVFLMPGGRLKLDTRDLYILGGHRGGIDERWFASTTKAANG